MLKSVLIIDDDPEMRKMLSEVLTSEGYLIQTAENGQDAILACERELFDLALIDIGLPDIIGTELLKLKILQPKMSTIIITGYASVESAMKAVALKADGYLQKPFEISVLMQLLKRIEDEKISVYFTLLSG